ncbi:MAG: sigma-70 family RNA polymerase sigma factor [Bellilinea sp.]
MIPSDEELVRQISNAQPGALESLYDRYGRLVFSLALRIIGSAGAAEEITQDVFIQVWNNAASYNSSLGKVTTWLTSITRYRSIDKIRRRNVRPDGHLLENSLEDMVISGPREELPAEQAETRLEEQRVRLALAELPQEQRSVILMAYFQGLSQPEMAAALNQPLGTVKTRVRLGLQKLRRLLEGSDSPDY